MSRLLLCLAALVVVAYSVEDTSEDLTHAEKDSKIATMQDQIATMQEQIATKNDQISNLAAAVRGKDTIADDGHGSATLLMTSTGTPASLGSTAGVGLDPLTCEEWVKTHDAAWCDSAPDGQEYLIGHVADYAGNTGGTNLITSNPPSYHIGTRRGVIKIANTDGTSTKLCSCWQSICKKTDDGESSYNAFPSQPAPNSHLSSPFACATAARAMSRVNGDCQSKSTLVACSISGSSWLNTNRACANDPVYSTMSKSTCSGAYGHGQFA